MDALQFPSKHLKIARLGRAAAEDDRVEVLAELFNLWILANVGAGDELDPLSFHHLHAPIDDALFQLELRNAVGEQSTNPIGSFEHGNIVPRAIELRRASQP